MNLRLRFAHYIILCLAWAGPASAQSVRERHQPRHELLTHDDAKAAHEWHMQPHPTIGGNQKTTATISRLVAYSVRRNGPYLDTVVLRYTSNERGGNDSGYYYGLQQIGPKYDTSTSWWRNTATSSAFTPRMRYLRTFDAQHRELTSTQQWWMNGAWRNQNRHTYYRDAAGRDTLATYEIWNNSTPAWVYWRRSSCTYNSNSQLINRFDLRWDTSTNTWRNDSRFIKTYDANGNETLSLSEYWNTTANTWINSWRYTSSYNNSGNLLTALYQTWNTSTNAWDTSDQATYTYDSQNRISSMLFQEWFLSALVYQQKVLYSYNALNQITGFVTQYGPPLGTSDSTVHTSLNAAGQPLTSLSYGWGPNATFSLRSRTTNTYTPGGLISTSLTESWNGNSFADSLRSFSFYNSFDQITRQYNEAWNGSAWIARFDDKDERYYYETVSTGIAGTPSQSIQAYLYPVPASQHVTLAMQWPSRQRIKATVFDASGKLIRQWSDDAAAGLYTKELFVENLPAGTYFLHVHGLQEKWSGSFQVVR